MSNAIDRLEEMEGRATGPTWRADELNSVRVVWDRPVGEPQPVVIHHVCFGHDRAFLCALRNASKPLLAVVRAGEKVQALMDEMTTPASLQAVLRPRAIVTEELDEARKALRLALATLKETTL